MPRGIRQRMPKINRPPRSSELRVCPVAPNRPVPKGRADAVGVSALPGRRHSAAGPTHYRDSRTRSCPHAKMRSTRGFAFRVPYLNQARRDPAIVRAQIGDRSRDIRRPGPIFGLRLGHCEHGVQAPGSQVQPNGTVPSPIVSVLSSATTMRSPGGQSP